jgi:ferredoxin
MKRNWIRGIVFVVAAVLALQVLPWRPAVMGFASLSPLLSLLGALAARAATLWILLGLPVLILGFYRSRWFCRFLCPVGFASEGIGRLNRKGRGRFAKWPHVGRWLLLLLLGGAAAGYPLFIWLDPLSLFNGFFSAWHAPFTWTSFALALGFLMVLLISWIAPQAWCYRICPLGALQDFLAFGRRKLEIRYPSPSSVNSHPAFGRRAFLGVVAGGAAALALRRLLPGNPLPVRPPGARTEDEFTGLCARCGACIRACPYHIIAPDFGGSGMTGLLTPVIDYSKAHCFEYCNECTQVCPTGAIERLALEAKRNLALGLAVVDRSKCLAWSHGQYCMVCHEFCPYLAIEPEEHNGVNCPVVKPDMCRGCGACQVECPALPDKAIVVQGTPQHGVLPLEDAAGPAG